MSINKILSFAMRKFAKAHHIIFKAKNYHFFSGERQTASTLEGIRKDHLERYRLAADFMNKNKLSKNLQALDIFCGNGYGSYLLAEKLDIGGLLSIDGSAAAIKHAQKNYCAKNIHYQARLFPFELDKNKYDFAVSMESVEHVEDDGKFLAEISNSLKKGGYLFLSAPNENKISLKLNPNHFHFRHYRPEKFINRLKEYGFDIAAVYGQDVYVINKDGLCAGLLDEKDFGLKQNYEGQFCIYILQKL